MGWTLTNLSSSSLASPISYIICSSTPPSGPQFLTVVTITTQHGYQGNKLTYSITIFCSCGRFIFEWYCALPRGIDYMCHNTQKWCISTLQWVPWLRLQIRPTFMNMFSIFEVYILKDRSKKTNFLSIKSVQLLVDGMMINLYQW